jgi:hypothetical protein
MRLFSLQQKAKIGKEGRVSVAVWLSRVIFSTSSRPFIIICSGFAFKMTNDEKVPNE